MSNSSVKQRNKFNLVINNLLFPYRALFKHNGRGEFIMSMEEERMTRVANQCKGIVLDIGCGPHNKFIKYYYSHGIGIDFYPYEGVDRVVEDPTILPFDTESFDTLTLIAVGGHIPKHLRLTEFIEFSRVIKRNGILIMTEGEPFTQYLHHKWVYLLDKIFKTSIDVDTERGMEDDEEYCIKHSEILDLFKNSGLKFLKRERFQWGLNNVFVATKL